MFISEISLKNIRNFHNLKIACHSNQTLVMGKNGTGKTTLLRSIALGLCPHGDANALLLEPVGEFIATRKSEGDEGEIEVITHAPYRRVGIQIKRLDDKNGLVKIETLEENEPFTPFVVGYGVGRANVGAESKFEYRVRDAVYSLFNYKHTLLNSELTLRRLQDFIGTRKYNSILLRIKEALDLSPEDKIQMPKGGGVVISGPSIGKQISLEAWADGYRLMFYWLIDLYGWAMQANSIGEDGHIRGIVLIDEIEQHLHPSLQTEILPRLAKLLPHVQLFATTHSPLVVLGASPQDVVVLRQVGSQIVKEEAIPDFTGYSAEDMLVDERLFDTPNVYSPDTNRKLAEYNQLAEIPREERSKDQTDRLRNLARELRTQEVPEFRQTTIDPQLKALLEKHNLTS